MPKNKQLNPRQRKFIAGALAGKSASKAAREAGYSESVSRKANAKILPGVRESITELLREEGLSNELIAMQAEQVIQHLWWIANSDPREFFDENNKLKPIHELPEHARKAIASFEVKTRDDGATVYRIRWWDKVKALELLIKIFRLISDGPNGPNDQRVVAANVELNVHFVSPEDIRERAKEKN